MAHLGKYDKTDYPKLLRHYERAKDKNGAYHKFKNQDIDLSRTNQNYNLADFQPLPQKEFMKRRLGQLKIFNRADVKYLCDWVVTLPKGMEHEESRFFKEVFKYLTDKYKKENVVSAYVHKDESQPHMHFAFIPVAMDKKKNIEKLCSKEVVTRNDMLAFHEEFDRYLTSVFGYPTGVVHLAISPPLCRQKNLPKRKAKAQPNDTKLKSTIHGYILLLPKNVFPI